MQPTCAGKALAPVWIVEQRFSHPLAALRRMHEATLTDVDANVSDVPQTWDDPVEHEITRLEFTEFDTARRGELLRRGTRHGDALLRMSVEDKATAVEPARGVRPAITVRCAQLRRRHARNRRALS
jgi:hypothetical protein